MHAIHHEAGPVSSTFARRRAAFAAIVAVAGLGCLGWGLAILGKAQAGQWLLEHAWQRAQATGVAPAPWPWADTRPVARILAPAQGDDVLVLAGAHGRTLAWGPGHLDGTALPGMPGQSVVTAHRDTHFRFLARVSVGDGLVVERADGVRVGYRVVATRVADASQLDLPREVERPTLTLVTCYPFDAVVPGGPLRYVVVAEAAAAPARRIMAAAGSRR